MHFRWERELQAERQLFHEEVVFQVCDPRSWRGLLKVKPYTSRLDVVMPSSSLSDSESESLEEEPR